MAGGKIILKKIKMFQTMLRCCIGSYIKIRDKIRKILFTITVRFEFRDLTNHQRWCANQQLLPDLQHSYPIYNALTRSAGWLF